MKIMQFPDVGQMTTEQVAQNAAAQQALAPGEYYRFEPPVVATGIPLGGPNICALAEVHFERGWYLGFVENKHVFQGKPINDSRVIPAPRGYEDDEDVVECLRECYFHVLFIGGAMAVLDPNQNP